MENPIRRSAAPVHIEDLDAFEAEVGLTLPAEYREFLLAHNGGVPRRDGFTHVKQGGKTRQTWLTWIYSLGREGLLDWDAEDLLGAYRRRPRGLPAGLLPVASAFFMGNTGFVCLACAGDRAGEVLFRPDVEPGMDTVYHVADSWTGFLEGMDYEDGAPRAWKIAIEDGEMDTLRDWLAKNRRAWKQDGGLAIEIQRAALAENSWAAVELLIGLGFEIDDLFEEALSSQRPDLLLRLLKTGKVSAKSIENALSGISTDVWHRPPILEELVAAGADVNARRDSASAPLHRAVDARSEAGIRCLLEHGADPTVKDDDGRTPLALANRLEEPRLAALLREGEAAWAKRPAVAGPEVVPFDFRGVTIGEPGPSLTIEEIRAFEETLGFTFPPEYRFFLLQANGGTPSPNRLPVAGGTGGDDEPEVDEDDDMEGEGSEDEPEQEPVVATFFRLRESDREPETKLRGDIQTVESMRGWYSDRGDIPQNMVAIGSLEGYGYEGYGFLLLGCQGKGRGKLFGFEFGDEPLDLTLPELFAAMGAGKPEAAKPLARLLAAIEERDLAGVRSALADGADPRKSTRDGREPILMACEAGFDDAVLAMAQAGVSPKRLFENAAMCERWTLARQLLVQGKGLSKKQINTLLVECRELYADAELLKALVERGGNLKVKLGGRPIALLNAASSGSLEGLKLVLAATGSSPLYCDHQGFTLLHFAATSGSVEMIQFLLEQGVKPNQPNATGQTALHFAVQAGHVAAAKALMDAGEDLQARHAFRMPGVGPGQMGPPAESMMEMLQGLMNPEDGPPPPDTSTPIGEKLAELRAALDRRKEGLAGAIQARMGAIAAGDFGKGRSAADLARKAPHLNAVLAELEAYAAGRPAPARPEAREAPSSADRVLKRAWFRHGDFYRDAAQVRDLLARGADPNERYEKGSLMLLRPGATPLHVAVAAGHPESVRALLDAGADPNAIDAEGNSPLHQVAPTEDGAAIGRMLLDRGARPNVWNERGETALHHAVRIGNVELARRLIDAGEDLHATQQKSVTLSQGHVHTFTTASAAEIAGRTIETRALLPELEAYAARKRGERTEGA